MIEEMGARRRRFRLAFGDRGQSLTEFLILGGLLMGSLGLFVRPWMAAAASWGFAIPVAFVIGHVLLEWRRQAAPEDRDDAEARRTKYDWASFLFSLACAVAGLAAFVIAIGAEPAPLVVDDGWQPPEGTVQSVIVPEH